MPNCQWPGCSSPATEALAPGGPPIVCKPCLVSIAAEAAPAKPAAPAKTVVAEGCWMHRCADRPAWQLDPKKDSGRKLCERHFETVIYGPARERARRIE